MYVGFLQLTHELQRNMNVQTFEIPQELIITNIEMLPVNFDPYHDTPEPDTLYLCEYWQLKRFDPHAKLPPILCVVEANAFPSAMIFSGRCMAAVYGSTLMDVLLGITNAAYNLGCKSSIVTEVSRNFLQCRSIEELISEGYRALKNPVIVTDYQQKILYAVDPNKVSSPIYRNILATEYLPTGHPIGGDSEKPWKAVDTPFYISGDQQMLIPIICKPLQVGTATLGYLHILQFSDTFNDDDIAIAELLGNLIAVELWRRRRSELLTPDSTEERFFRDILDNQLGNNDAVLERQKKLNITLKKHLYALVFMLKKADAFNSSHRIPFSELTAMVKNTLVGSHPFLYKNSVFVVVESDNEISDFYAYLKPITPALEQYHLTVGVSNEMPGIYMLREAGYMCRKALQMGSAMHPEKSICRYQDYTIYYMMELCLKNEDMMALCPPALRNLMNYCKENGGELMETLETYLNCGRSKSTTAKEMYVHVNTVKYRIAQIQELTGLDLSDDSTAFELMIAFRMFEYRKCFDNYEPILNSDG